MLNQAMLRLLLSLMSDENIRSLINPFKHDLCAALEKQAAESPGVVDDVLVRLLKAFLGVV